MLLEHIGTELELTERHLLVLKKVIEEAPIGILKLADVTGMQNHKVRYSLRVLEQANLIKPSAQGAVPGEAVPKFLEEFEQELEKINKKLALIREIEVSIPKN
jgi:predicted transcriptional regulator